MNWIVSHTEQMNLSKDPSQVKVIGMHLSKGTMIELLRKESSFRITKVKVMVLFSRVIEVKIDRSGVKRE